MHLSRNLFVALLPSGTNAPNSYAPYRGERVTFATLTTSRYWQHWPVQCPLRVCSRLQCTSDDDECVLLASRLLQNYFTRSQVPALRDKWFTARQAEEQGWQGGSVHRGRGTFIPHMPTRFSNGGNSAHLGKYLKSFALYAMKYHADSRGLPCPLKCMRFTLARDRIQPVTRTYRYPNL